eukprot:TRINITY_DN5392_c0_g1_i1.p1 TRINITY_DN5392_c0_g1~~TRINITY_DN5392_c0_g1_i1.p1  ORF type:complete len:210 (+),score=36.11 TRINITY_DN5392_c0_g1_i1:341-970(+)
MKQIAPPEPEDFLPISLVADYLEIPSVFLFLEWCLRSLQPADGFLVLVDAIQYSQRELAIAAQNYISEHLTHVDIDSICTLPQEVFLEIIQTIQKRGTICAAVSRLIVEYILVNEDELDTTSFEVLANLALVVSNNSDTFQIFLRSVKLDVVSIYTSSFERLRKDFGGLQPHQLAQVPTLSNNTISLLQLQSHNNNTSKRFPATPRFRI